MPCLVQEVALHHQHRSQLPRLGPEVRREIGGVQATVKNLHGELKARCLYSSPNPSDESPSSSATSSSVLPRARRDASAYFARKVSRSTLSRNRNSPRRTTSTLVLIRSFFLSPSTKASSSGGSVMLDLVLDFIPFEYHGHPARASPPPC